MTLIMILLTLVIAYATVMALVWAIQEKKPAFWVGFVFTLACLGIAVLVTVNTYLGLAMWHPFV